MTRSDLIYDWKKSESSFRDKLASYVIVAVLFAAAFGFFHIPYSATRNERPASASILRFRENALGDFWMLQAEENGPFPGRLGVDADREILSAAGLAGGGAWNTYKVRLRGLAGEGQDPDDALAVAGKRVFPSRIKLGEGQRPAAPGPGTFRQRPILIPFDAAALARLPDELPDFVMPEGELSAPATWRFTINLDAKGAVRESISLGGGDDAGQAAMEAWLRGVRFKEGEGNRWIGLRVEFVNQSENGTDAE